MTFYFKILTLAALTVTLQKLNSIWFFIPVVFYMLTFNSHKKVTSCWVISDRNVFKCFERAFSLLLRCFVFFPYNQSLHRSQIHCALHLQNQAHSKSRDVTLLQSNTSINPQPYWSINQHLVLIQWFARERSKLIFQQLLFISILKFIVHLKSSKITAMMSKKATRTM